jgi:putative DNA methylase
MAWLWARTVKSPNPAFTHVDVPLVSTFVLSKMKGNEAHVEPVLSPEGYSFVVRPGPSPATHETLNGTKLVVHH